MRSPESLLDEIAREPRAKDLELLRVYADQLIEAGDARGELIVVACQRAVKDSRELERRERELLEIEQQRLHAVLGRFHYYMFRFGVVDEVHFDYHGDEAFDAWSKLVAEPAFRLLRRIQIAAVQMDGYGNMAPIFAELAQLAPRFPRLTELALHEGMNLGNPWIDGPIDVGDIDPLLRAFPQLEVLELEGNRPRFSELALPRLKRLVVGGLHADQIRPIVQSQLRALEHLELAFEPQRIENIPSTFGPLLHRDFGPQLQSLAVAPPPLAARHLIDELPGSPLARHVKWLSFRAAWLDEGCYDSLLAQAATLRRLDGLVLVAKRIPAATQKRLAQALGNTLRLV
ncbi:MAG TPA: hypothetical protein VFQ53_02870 [Kofleriaceae bacterium]|nr:hypothetical protein [Kofleriaceae bacterium]